MPPTQFDVLVLPEKEEEDQRDRKYQGNNNKKTEIGELLAPKEYLVQLERRNKHYSGIKAKIAKSGLSADMTKNLHAALQGNFR